MHVVASSCSLYFISVCTFHFFLMDDASSMQMICSIFKVFVFCSGRVLWVGFLILLNGICFGFVLCLFGDSNNPFPKKLYLCPCVLDTVEDEIEMVLEARVELNS